MARWRLSMLGSTTATRVGGSTLSLPSSCWPLIGFLLTMPRREAQREAVAAALWPSMADEAARHCLASTLWRIKAAFGAGANPVIAKSATLALGRSRLIWIDTIALEHRAAPLLRSEAIPAGPARDQIRRVLIRTTGAFLPAVDDEWALIERERLRAVRLDALFALAGLYARDNDWQSVVSTTRALCAAEPLREDAHRLLMLAYAKTGNRALALQQFRRCAEVLETELGVAPMEETAALHRSLGGRPPLGETRPSELQSALIATRATMHSAIAMIDTALATL